MPRDRLAATFFLLRLGAAMAGKKEVLVDAEAAGRLGDGVALLGDEFDGTTRSTS